MNKKYTADSSNKIKVRKLKENHSACDSSSNSNLKKANFTDVSAKLEEKLNHLLKSKPEKQIRVIDLELIINKALIEADAPEAINRRVLDKLGENSNSPVALMSYIYGFILRSKNQGVIDGSTTDKLDLINRKNHY